MSSSIFNHGACCLLTDVAEQQFLPCKCTAAGHHLNIYVHKTSRDRNRVWSVWVHPVVLEVVLYNICGELHVMHHAVSVSFSYGAVSTCVCWIAWVAQTGTWRRWSIVWTCRQKMYSAKKLRAMLLVRYIVWWGSYHHDWPAPESVPRNNKIMYVCRWTHSMQTSNSYFCVKWKFWRCDNSCCKQYVMHGICDTARTYSELK